MNETDCIRMEVFRQLSKKIRGSEEYLVVGMDMAKEKHRVFLGAAAGKTLFRRLVFDNNIGGFEKLFDQVPHFRL